MEATVLTATLFAVDPGPNVVVGVSSYYEGGIPFLAGWKVM